MIRTPVRADVIPLLLNVPRLASGSAARRRGAVVAAAGVGGVRLARHRAEPDRGITARSDAAHRRRAGEAAVSGAELFRRSGATHADTGTARTHRRTGQRACTGRRSSGPRRPITFPLRSRAHDRAPHPPTPLHLPPASDGLTIS